MAELTGNEFSKHFNSNFNVQFVDGELPLELVEVAVYRPQEYEHPGMGRFPN